MKIRMVEQRDGELLGPIDWSYDFTQHDWGKGHGGHNPELTPRSVEALKKLEAWHKEHTLCFALLYGSWQEVWDIGMYDGWPYWEPTPSIFVKSALGGGEWHDYLSISGAKAADPAPSAPGKE